MQTYILYVHCRRNGVNMDAGEHARCEADTDEKALGELIPELNWLRQFYDEISWTVREGSESGRVVRGWG